jgi:hypothetical protein
MIFPCVLPNSFDVFILNDFYVCCNQGSGQFSSCRNDYSISMEIFQADMEETITSLPLCKVTMLYGHVSMGNDY